MSTLDRQTAYWDGVADKKAFTHPIRMEMVRALLPLQSRILDYGCGYGRTCAELVAAGYTDVVGVDISSAMIDRGRALHPDLGLRHIEGDTLPFADNHFDACFVLAVLTCIPTDSGLKKLMAELRRVLRPGGLLYVSDYPLQQDERNQKRYRQFEKVFGAYGTFRLSDGDGADGGVVRHYEMPFIYKLLSGFDIVKEFRMMVSTMEGNKAEIFQIISKVKK